MASTLDTFFEERGVRKTLLTQIAIKFGTVPDEVKETTTNANLEQLEHWVAEIMKVESLSEMGFSTNGVAENGSAKNSAT